MINNTILMVAAENDALPKAKVGGVGDVLRDLPIALADQGCRVHTVIPSYGFLHQLPGSQKVTHFPLAFAGGLVDVSLYQLSDASVKPGCAHPRVHHWVLHHPYFAPCGNKVYCNDGSDRPFATDASKFALFCAALGEAILHNAFAQLDFVHLHDWHSALICVLREYDPHYKKLQSLPFVYTVHNLALQGVRPFLKDTSSLEHWFPQLNYDANVICDPTYTHCFNPVRAAIGLADKIHTVSPSYAKEIQVPSDKRALVYGGEGLEPDLRSAAAAKRLFGILNGCEYSEAQKRARLGKAKLVEVIGHALLQWAASEPVMASAHWLAEQRLKQWAAKKERGFLITSVGRLTEQKVALMKMPVERDGKTQSALDHILSALGQDATFVALGTGDLAYERFLREVSARHPSFIYLQGFSETMADALYASGDLFLMPSSFEPCGISQMLAMRQGQPCVVNAVGGLKDTVNHGVNGFVFAGENGTAQAQAFVETTLQAVAMAKTDPKAFKALGKNAEQARFLWTDAARDYLENLYSL